MSGKIVDKLIILFLIFIAIWSIIPFTWSVVSSLKTREYIMKHPLSWIPKPLAFDNYVKITTKFRIGRDFVNSLIYAGGTALIAMLLCPMAGYALAKKKFKGRNILFIFVLSLMMIPHQVTMIPNFLILKFFPLVGGNNILGQGGTGLLDTYWGLILPKAVQPLFIFLARQFFLSLPTSLIEAARIDGASEFKIYWDIALPLAKPAVTAIGIFAFQWSWNDFIWPLIVTRSPEMETIQIGLQVFNDEFGDLWNLLMAATNVAILPMLIIFIIFQKHFFKGVSFMGSYR